MRNIVINLLLASILLGGEYNLKPNKVDDGLWCVFGDLNPPTKENKGFVSNICWVENDKKLILLDAGPTTLFAKELENAIATTTDKKISHVVLTNYHDDRILAASYFQSKGAKIVAHKNIISDIEKNPSKFERLSILLTKEQYAGTNLPKIDISFEGKELDLGTAVIYKLSKVSETPSDIVAYMPKQKALFAGNILFGERGLNYDKDSNINGWLEALKKIEILDVKYFIPGHGTKTDKSNFDVTKNYLSSLYSQTKKAYEDGVELEELSSIVSMKEFSYLINYEQRHMLNLYNLYEDFDFQVVD